MSITYRAAYIGDCVFTDFAQSLLDDDALKTAAIETAYRANLIPAEEDPFRAQIEIGEWTERGTCDLAVYEVTESGALERHVVEGWEGSIQDYLDYRELTDKGTIPLTGWPEARAIDCGRALVAPLFAL